MQAADWQPTEAYMTTHDVTQTKTNKKTEEKLTWHLVFRLIFTKVTLPSCIISINH